MSDMIIREGDILWQASAERKESAEITRFIDWLADLGQRFGAEIGGADAGDLNFGIRQFGRFQPVGHLIEGHGSHDSVDLGDFGGGHAHLGSVEQGGPALAQQLHLPEVGVVMFRAGGRLRAAEVEHVIACGQQRLHQRAASDAD